PPTPTSTPFPYTTLCRSALERFPSALPREEDRTAVATDVHEGTQLAVAVAHQHDGQPAGSGRDVGARLRQLARVRCVLPEASKDALLFEPKDGRFGVPAPRKRPPTSARR